MPGTILENLSGRKLSILVTILLVFQMACFLVGITSPSPARSQTILATVCEVHDTNLNEDINVWFSRENCSKIVDLQHPESTANLEADNLVFMMEIPLYGEDFSRWQQNLVGILQIDSDYHKNLQLLEPVVEISIDARLAYSNKLPNSKKTEWKYYAHSEEKRYMDCSIDKSIKNLDGHPYDCSMVPLFELGCLYHDYYLLNVRLPYNYTSQKNTKLTSRVTDMYLHIIHMNGGFTQVWLSMKMIFFPIITSIMVWFWNRVRMLTRVAALLECMLMCLGGALALLDLPLEYLSLHFEMPYMLLLGDIRQGIFYAALLSFWLVFAGEHMLIQDNGCKNSIKLYWKHLSTIIIGCLSLLIFDLCERGVQLINPFYSIWVTPIGTNLALTFIILGGLSASLYFVFLCYMIWSVFKNISIKRSVLPSMNQARRLHYEGIIYRFNFLMLATLVCAAVTIISFILSQVSESQNKWDENVTIQLSSVMHTGVYGMWNVYICGMLILYAPSHKQWPSEQICDEGEEVEFNRLPVDSSPNEISSLTSFATKANID
ncbi:protein wntless [Coccinella septempunctata]|uniref:protein wntless n=1 Tax=Coccinella septempunctata TaxID=41139 RepID=UPI001D0813AF|nr:protein wntless [Coccinella septempunctata]